MTRKIEKFALLWIIQENRITLDEINDSYGELSDAINELLSEGSVIEKDGVLRISSKKEDIPALFLEAANHYPGTVQSRAKLFLDFKKKNKENWRSILPLLKPAIDAQIEHKRRLLAQNKFVPEWQHFSTWLNNNGWDYVVNIEPQEPISSWYNQYLTDSQVGGEPISAKAFADFSNQVGEFSHKGGKLSGQRMLSIFDKAHRVAQNAADRERHMIHLYKKATEQ